MEFPNMHKGYKLYQLPGAGWLSIVDFLVFYDGKTTHIINIFNNFNRIINYAEC